MQPRDTEKMSDASTAELLLGGLVHIATPTEEESLGDGLLLRSEAEAAQLLHPELLDTGETELKAMTGFGIGG
jgi:hypothetical protein